MGHFSKFVRPGSIRMGLSVLSGSVPSAVQTVAFQTQEGMNVIVVQNRGFSSSLILDTCGNKTFLLLFFFQTLTKLTQETMRSNLRCKLKGRAQLRSPCLPTLFKPFSILKSATIKNNNNIGFISIF